MKKPVKPKKQIAVPHNWSVYLEHEKVSLKDLMDIVHEHISGSVDYKDIKLQLDDYWSPDWDGGGIASDHIILAWEEMEDDPNYEQELKKYERKMRKWKKEQR